ncbi:hypothetical protein ASZ78_008647, partial [Callipepla squamata]
MPEPYEVDDIDEEGKEQHTLSRRRVILLPQWKANPETDPKALFQREQLVLALYLQTTCFYRALIHAPPLAAAKMVGIYSDADPPQKPMRRRVLMTLLQQSAMRLPLWIGKPSD